MKNITKTEIAICIIAAFTFIAEILSIVTSIRKGLPMDFNTPAMIFSLLTISLASIEKEKKAKKAMEN